MALIFIKEIYNKYKKLKYKNINFNGLHIFLLSIKNKTFIITIKLIFQLSLTHLELFYKVSREIKITFHFHQAT